MHNVTFLLGGGNMTLAQDGGRAFYRKIVGTRNTAKILICCFAQSQVNQVIKFEEYKRIISAFNTEATIQYLLASPDNFIQQVGWSDIVIFTGGSSRRLLNVLSENGGWEASLSGKTVVGSSAGAHMLSTTYVVDEVPTLSQGLGLLPIMLVTHYRSVSNRIDGEAFKEYWNRVDDLLKSSSGKMAVVNLKEGEFVVYEFNAYTN